MRNLWVPTPRGLLNRHHLSANGRPRPAPRGVGAAPRSARMGSARRGAALSAPSVPGSVGGGSRRRLLRRGRTGAARGRDRDAAPPPPGLAASASRRCPPAARPRPGAMRAAAPRYVEHGLGRGGAPRDRGGGRALSCPPPVSSGLFWRARPAASPSPRVCVWFGDAAGAVGGPARPRPGSILWLG